MKALLCTLASCCVALERGVALRVAPNRPTTPQPISSVWSHTGCCRLLLSPCHRGAAAAAAHPGAGGSGAPGGGPGVQPGLATGGGLGCLRGFVEDCAPANTVHQAAGGGREFSMSPQQAGRGGWVIGGAVLENVVCVCAVIRNLNPLLPRVPEHVALSVLSSCRSAMCCLRCCPSRRPPMRAISRAEASQLDRR